MMQETIILHIEKGRVHIKESMIPQYEAVPFLLWLSGNHEEEEEVRRALLEAHHGNPEPLQELLKKVHLSHLLFSGVKETLLYLSHIGKSYGL